MPESASGGVYLVRGGVYSRVVYLVPGGVWSGGAVSAPTGWGGCLVPRGCLVSGVSALGGGCLPQGVCVCVCGIPACRQADTPPVNIITHTCKNITLATTSLRPVTTVTCERALGFIIQQNLRMRYRKEMGSILWDFHSKQTLY